MVQKEVLRREGARRNAKEAARASQDALQESRAALRDAVVAAREAGATWSAIGAVLGVTAQRAMALGTRPISRRAKG